MRREFCTLFDAHYLVKAVALHGSLLRHCPDFHLTAFCFDDEALELLERLDLPCLSLVSLDRLEALDPGLAATKADRSRGEYCWTATPALPRAMFALRPQLEQVTYIDADLWFFSDPEPLFDELGDDSVLVTEHRYPREYAHHEINGRFNVQFLVFRRDAHGLEVLEWWHERCLEWCYARLEDGRFGDQKYLEDWPRRFEGVHVLRHRGGGVAPWNVVRHELRQTPDGVTVDGDPLVFFHFHKLRMLERGYDWRAPGYIVPARARLLIYEPYLAALDAARERVLAVEPGFRGGIEASATPPERVRHARALALARLARHVPGVSRVRATVERLLGAAG
jgi:hypothetical protein